MKKIISIKEITMILISVLVITISLHVFAFDPSQVVGGNNNTTNNATTISGNEYNEAQNNNTENNTANNTNNSGNINNNTSLPQTGIEDYNIGILLVICIASAVFAYKKVNDYRNI